MPAMLQTKRRQLVEIRKRLRRQVRQRHSHKFDEMDSELLSLLTRQIADLEESIEKAISSCLNLSRRAEILRSIPGIGPVPTANLIGDLPGMGHCSDKQIAALVASNHNPVRHIFAERLKEKGKPHKVVLIVVARKLLIIANTLIAKDTVWEPS